MGSLCSSHLCERKKKKRRRTIKLTNEQTIAMIKAITTDRIVLRIPIWRPRRQPWIPTYLNFKKKRAWKRILAKLIKEKDLKFPNIDWRHLRNGPWKKIKRQAYERRRLFPDDLDDIDRRVFELLAMPIPRPQDVP